MNILKDICRITVKANIRNRTFSNTSVKETRKLYVNKLVWNKPKPLPFNHFAHTGDLESFEVPPSDTIRAEFQNSEKLKNASEKVKKIFSLHYLSRRHYYNIYEKQITDKVKNHEYDKHSLEFRIGYHTAKVRYFKYCCNQEPHNKNYITAFYNNVSKRQKFLKLLRKENYSKFEWILDQLNIVFRPYTCKKPLSRKDSLRKLATIEAKTEIEDKRVALQKLFDSKKIPFLEKKIEKLNWIRETEKANSLPTTVTDADITDCMKKLAEVKINLSEKMKQGYERKIDPCSLEFYNEELLIEKEKGNI